MKKYRKELIILILQILLFYILPLFAGPTDAMGLIVLIIFFTFSFSLILGIISKNKIKYLYPIIISIIFIPTIFIYYNTSAFVHCIWYLVISFIGLFVGVGTKFVINFLYSKMKH